MFTLDQPSMALNSIDFPGEIIRMEITAGPISGTESPQAIITRVVNGAARVSGGKLKNVVFNCHGLPGYIGIGQGIRRSHLGLFRQWAGKVFKIWFIACKLARIPTREMQAKLDRDYPGYETGNGDVFCKELARLSGAYVVVPTEDQGNTGGYSLGQMPTFEGLLLSYSPHGGPPWRHHYRSGQESADGRTMRTPSGE